MELTDPRTPAARPVPADAVREAVGPTAWIRGVAWTLGAVAAAAVASWVAGTEVGYGVVVAMTALAFRGTGRNTVGAVIRALLAAGALALAGAVTLGALGWGLPVHDRLVQSAGGLLAATVVMSVPVVRARVARDRTTG